MKGLRKSQKVWPVSNSDELADVVVNALLFNYRRLDEIGKQKFHLNCPNSAYAKKELK